MSYQTVVDHATHCEIYRTQEFWSAMILLTLGVAVASFGFAAIVFERFVLKYSVATQCLKRGKISRRHSWRDRVSPPPPSCFWMARHKLRLLLRWNKLKRPSHRRILRPVTA